MLKKTLLCTILVAFALVGCKGSDESAETPTPTTDQTTAAPQPNAEGGMNQAQTAEAGLTDAAKDADARVGSKSGG